MVKNRKNYFSFFGILSATVNRKMHSIISSVETIINQNMPEITKIVLSSQLKPIKLYSTNNINK